LKKDVGNSFCNGGVPCAKWQTLSLYRVSKLFPSRSHGYSVTLTPLGFWTDGLRAVYGTVGETKKMIVLEFVSSMFSAQGGTIATREQGMC